MTIDGDVGVEVAGTGFVSGLGSAGIAVAKTGGTGTSAEAQAEAEADKKQSTRKGSSPVQCLSLKDSSMMIDDDGLESLAHDTCLLCVPCDCNDNQAARQGVVSRERDLEGIKAKSRKSPQVLT